MIRFIDKSSGYQPELSICLFVMNALTDILAQRLHFHPEDAHLQTISGGSINRCQALSVHDQRYFVKVNSATAYPGLFEKEKNGLQQLQSAYLRTPKTVDCFAEGGQQFLVLEWISQELPTKTYWTRLGEQLASLHRHQSANYGYSENNYIGALPQVNDEESSWTAFFSNHRVLPLVKRAVDTQLLTAEHVKPFDRILQFLPSLFEEEPPCLLHGDLWSGNMLCGPDQTPVFIDPAVYFGHRSMDLAMTHLFGGFDPIFYDAYNEAFPFPSHYREQWELCNLYPLLVHLILFGAGYRSSILELIRRY